MFDKLKQYKSHPIFEQIEDIRVVGLIIFAIITLLVTWSGVGAIETNYSLQQQISKLQQENNLQGLQNNNLQLQNQYYNTNEYLELQARQLLGKAAPGEKLIIVPQTVALAQLSKISSTTSSDKATTTLTKPFYQSNFESWINFFFHRDS